MIMVLKRPIFFVLLLVLVLALTGCIESLAGVHPNECNAYCDNPNHMFTKSPDGSTPFNHENNYISAAAWIAETSTWQNSQCAYRRYYGVSPTSVIGGNTFEDPNDCNPGEWDSTFLSDVINDGYDSEVPRQEASAGTLELIKSDDGWITGKYTHKVIDGCAGAKITLQVGFDHSGDDTTESVYLSCTMRSNTLFGAFTGGGLVINPGDEQVMASTSVGVNPEGDPPGVVGWGDVGADEINSYNMPQDWKDRLIGLDTV